MRLRIFPSQTLLSCALKYYCGFAYVLSLSNYNSFFFLVGTAVLPPAVIIHQMARVRFQFFGISSP